MSKVNYIEIRDKKTGKVTTVELGGAGGAGNTIITKNAIMETDDSGDVATGMALVDGFTYEELTALLNDRNSKVVLDLSEGRGYQCYVLDQLLFMNQLADHNFAQVVYKCNDYLFANKIIILAITYQDGEMNYQIALLDANSATGEGGGTSDTAYVEDEVLYIEEGTTAAGGGGLKVVKITEFAEIKNATVEINEDRYNECRNADVLNIVIGDALSHLCYKDLSFDFSSEGLGVATSFSLPTPYAYHYKESDDYTNNLISGFDILRIGVTHKDNVFSLELTLEEKMFKSAA